MSEELKNKAKTLIEWEKEAEKKVKQAKIDEVTDESTEYSEQVCTDEYSKMLVPLKLVTIEIAELMKIFILKHEAMERAYDHLKALESKVEQFRKWLDLMYSASVTVSFDDAREKFAEVFGEEK